MRLEPHDPRLLRGSEPDREDGPERDRHLSEDVSRPPLAENPLDAVHDLRRFDATLEDGEERSLRSLVRRVLARPQDNVRRRLRQALAVLLRERSEDRNCADLVRRDHAATLSGGARRESSSSTRHFRMSLQRSRVLGVMRVPSRESTLAQPNAASFAPRLVLPCRAGTTPGRTDTRTGPLASLLTSRSTSGLPEMRAGHWSSWQLAPGALRSRLLRQRAGV